MMQGPGPQCDEDRLQAVLALAAQDTQLGIGEAERALADFPDDPRLHFLRGSLLIEQRRFVEAHAALSRAVALAPDFHLARFQLGFFELTSGEPDAARASWQPLRQALPPGHFLARFVAGLEALLADRFADCIAALREGISANAENPPLNRDMELIVEKCEELLRDRRADDGEDGPGAISAASLLLGSRRH
jgi:tetratricopeptide (TPR) repeat protein